MATGAAVHRCGWVSDDPLYIRYHDEEWGVPSHDDRHLFEMMVLEGAQAGLSWITILKKREHYRAAFANFDAEKVVRFTDADQQRLLADPGIVRNRAKVASTILNAQAVLKIRADHGSLDTFLWRFAGGKPRTNRWKTFRDAPPKTPESDAMSKALLAYGCKFVGPTICYAFMQATGMVNDHETGCCRFHDVARFGENEGKK